MAKEAALANRLFARAISPGRGDPGYEAAGRRFWEGGERGARSRCRRQPAQQGQPAQALGLEAGSVVPTGAAAGFIGESGVLMRVQDGVLGPPVTDRSHLPEILPIGRPARTLSGSSEAGPRR